jgi:type IV fimbrial biogenesis protein FimT
VLKVRAAQCGFNLIEVMISIVVLGVLISLAGPSFFEFMQNSQIRTAADAMQNGLQAARGAAISRNLPVRISIGPLSGWTVAESASGTLIESRVAEEGTPNVGVNVTPLGAIAITFSPLGAVTANSDGTASVTQLDFVNPSGGNCQTASGPMRCLRVLVTGGGSVRMCDPKFDPAATPRDPRAC